MKRYIKYILYFKLIVMIIIPILLIILPSDYMDHGQSLCLSRLIFNRECWGCGSARACMHFVHFDFREAWKFNKLSIIVTPILAFLWIKEIYKDIVKITKLGEK
jgi:hypothetical protein